MSAQQTIEKHQFGDTTSIIGYRLGKVYIYNKNDVSDSVWYLDDGDKIEWATKYRSLDDFTNFNEKADRQYVDMSISGRIDWILKGLLKMRKGHSTEEWKNAVVSNSNAIKWVNNLQLAKDKLDWWFADGCPLEPDELEIIERWAEQETDTHKKFSQKSSASGILSIRHKAHEMNQNESTRNQE